MTVHELIGRLDAAGIRYTLTSVRENAVMVCVAVPGERWELEVFPDGVIEIERFKSTGDVVGIDDTALTALISHWSDTE